MRFPQKFYFLIFCIFNIKSQLILTKVNYHIHILLALFVLSDWNLAGNKISILIGTLVQCDTQHLHAVYCIYLRMIKVIYTTRHDTI